MIDSTDKIRRKKKKRNNLRYVLEIILCLISMTAILFSVIILFQYRNLKNINADLNSELAVFNDPNDPYVRSKDVDELLKSNYEQAYMDGTNGVYDQVREEIKNNLIDSKSPIETIKRMFPDELLVLDEGEYLFFPIRDDLKKHIYQDDDFRLVDDRIEYTGDIKTITGIDVSKFQEKISWSQVAEDGIDYAIIRVAYRGYSKGDIMDDETFEKNIKGALDNDIDVGVYFLSQATSDKEALEEAQYVLDAIEPYNITYPIVLDIEAVGGKEGRGNALSVEERTQYAITFLEAIKKSGYDVCIYGNMKSFMLMLDISKLEDYSKWFAGYTAIPYFPYEFDIWQYTDTGHVNGISKPVDINIQFIKD